MRVHILVFMVTHALVGIALVFAGFTAGLRIGRTICLSEPRTALCFGVIRDAALIPAVAFTMAAGFAADVTKSS